MSASNDIFTLHYDDKDYNHSVTWSDYHLKKCSQSKLDLELRTRWASAMEAGCFRYDLNHLVTRVLDGNYRFVVQLNSRRAVERRSPESVMSLQTPFDAKKFNFIRIHQREILFNLHCDDVTNHDIQRISRHPVVINVSPLEFGNVLLLPDVDACQPQVLTESAVKLAVQFLLLSSHPGFRIGFNSLCALASVNHLHFHAWYLEHPLFIESALLQHYVDNVYELISYPARAFVLLLSKSSVEKLAKRAFEIVNHLQTNDIAHNVFITRGASLDVDVSEATVRVYIFPRLSVVGKKDEMTNVFNVAVCELGGHVPTYVESKFPEITENFIVDRIQEQMLPTETYEKISNEIRTLLLAQ